MVNLSAIEAPKVEEQKRPTLAPNTFSPASLLSWLTFAQEANVPYLPAEDMGEIHIERLLRSDEADADLTELDKLIHINLGLQPGYMLRFDTCAPMNIKSVMAKGLSLSRMKTEDLHLDPGDPRAFDLLFTFPKEKVSILKRPIIEPMTHLSYPVEFRVYIHQNEVVAVSNYYPQIDLPESYENIDHAKLAISYAGKILDAIKASGQHMHYAHGARDDLNATLDFMVKNDGQMVLIEGGPGFGFGGHPCCFYDNDQDKMQALEGMRFSVQGQSIPLQKPTMKV